MSAARSRRANDKHNHLQRTPILVMGCSLLIACCIAFGGTNWTASAQGGNFDKAAAAATLNQRLS